MRLRGSPENQTNVDRQYEDITIDRLGPPLHLQLFITWLILMQLESSGLCQMDKYFNLLGKSARLVTITSEF